MPPPLPSAEIIDLAKARARLRKPDPVMEAYRAWMAFLAALAFPEWRK